MATYFHQSSEIQAPDGLQTLVLMNPSFVQYSADAQPAAGGSSLVFLNSASTAAPTSHLAHMLPPPQQTQQFVGIPLSVSATTASQDHQSPVPAMPEVSPFHGLIPRPQHSLWRSVEPSTQARETPRGFRSHQGGLSLSLSSLQPPGFGSLHREREPARSAASGGEGGGCGGSPSSTSDVTRNGGALGIQGVLLSSKYLKAVQELLDEAVHVESRIDKADTSKKAGSSGESKAAGESSSSVPAAAWKEENSGKGCVTELSTAERQEIQMKKAKLINMIDEVEHRYRQYHRQMQIVISSFELAAGASSAKTYTALALQTILKQFRCLKDAIAGQIKAANKSLGEEEDSPRAKLEGSRLKFVDRQFRQQRALQQLGMIQNHPWRPQRGLPERSVSILRAWLFEHFLHPYPKDSDKLMLAEQTGLTRSQVSNWFINARVRLWKPMVEEMYSEETKEHEKNGIDEKTGSKSIVPDEDTASKSSSPQDKGPSSENISNKSFKSKETNSMSQDALAISTNSASPIGGNLSALPGFAPVRTLELEGIAQVTKKPRSTEVLHSPNNVLSLEDQLTMKFGDERAQGRDGYSVMGGPMNFIGGFGQCPIEEIGRFGADQFVPSPTFAGNAVSLTLGLPHTENLLLSIDHHQAFLPSQNVHFGRRVKVGEGNEFRVVDNPITAPPHSFHCI